MPSPSEPFHGPISLTPTNYHSGQERLQVHFDRYSPPAITPASVPPKSSPSGDRNSFVRNRIFPTQTVSMMVIQEISKHLKLSSLESRELVSLCFPSPPFRPPDLVFVLDKNIVHDGTSTCERKNVSSFQQFEDFEFQLSGNGGEVVDGGVCRVRHVCGVLFGQGGKWLK